ncbi:MAG: hypothetical protein HKN12_00865 [Gemmatimonadetes bacterium]|nr:hypothetical protein [Gemmatimonadota bacterium]
MNLARLRAIQGVDFRSYLTRPPVYFLLVLLALTSFGLSSGDMAIMSGDTTVGGESKQWMTSEFTVAMVFPLVAFLFYVFFVAVLAGMAIPRDEELRVGPVIHATKLSPGEYVWGKFAAVLGIFLLVLAAHLAFQMIFNHLWPHADAEKIRGPFLLMNYLRPATLLALPCLVFFAGASFAVGEFTRKPILIFVTPVLAFLVSIFFLFDWSPSWLDPRINNLLMWIEPSGYRWINETWLKVDRGVDFYNTTPVGYDMPFLLSRLAFLVAGFGFVAMSVGHHEKSLRGNVGTKTRSLRKQRLQEPATSAPAYASGDLRSLDMTARSPGFVRTVIDVAAYESRNLLSQPGLYLFGPIILLQIILNFVFDVGAFDTPILLTTGFAAVGALNSLTLMVTILLMVYTAESVMRDQTTGLAPISFSTPARTGAMLLGKALANGLVGAVILLAAALGIRAVMLIQGGTVPFEIRPLLIVWGGLLVPTLIVWASFITAVVALTRSRFAAYGVGLAALIYSAWKNTRGEVNWVGNWNLSGAVTWSDFGSLDPNAFALLLNRAFYLAVLVFLVAFTVRVFPRRDFDSGATLDRLRPWPLLKTAFRMLPVALPAIVLGSFLNAQVSDGHQGPAAEKRAEDYWGRNVLSWIDAPEPELGAVDIAVELDPPERWFRVNGTYHLVNATEETMRRFPMTTGDHFENVSWTLHGEEFEPDDRAGLFVFELASPLAPGDTVVVGFSHEGTYPKGLSKNGGGAANFVLPAGVVLTSFNTGFLPLPSFDPDRGVDEDNQMEPKEWEDDFFEGITPPALGVGVRFPVRTEISGPAEYRYHGVGVKQSETVEDGVRHVVWKSDFPVNFFNIVAGKWDVWEGEGVEIYHHPKHTYNIDMMGRALEGSRKYYSEWFYPYPWQDLRLNEFPGIATYAQGFPTNITFSEHIGFLTRATEESNAPFLVTAHEAAHQWWGNILMPGEGPGGNILSEGMAHFSTILLFDQMEGEEARAEFCKGIEASYGDSRRVDSEKPLVKTLGDKPSDTTVMYDKGGWVFYMLHRLMGDEASFAGIRAFVEKYGGGPDFPVLQDYVREMRAFAPDAEAYDAFVDQWFFDVVVPEFRLEDSVKEADGDAWVVTTRVRNRGSGTVSVPVAAVRGERGEDAAADEPWMAEETRIVVAPGDEVEVVLRTDFEPQKVVVDPDVTVLMLERHRAEVDL